MQKRHIKLMIISALVFLTLVFFPNTNVKAANYDNMPDAWGVGTKFKLCLGDDANESNYILTIRNEGNSTKWLYCIHDGAPVNVTDDSNNKYEINHIVNIQGLKAEHNGSSGESIENAELAYILNAGEKKGYNQDGSTTDTQQAIWYHWYTWYSWANKKDGVNFKIDGIYGNRKDGENSLLKEAEIYAKNLFDGGVSTPISSMITDNYKTDAFKINYNGSIKSIKVEFSDGSSTTINTGNNNSNLKFYYKSNNEEIKNIEEIKSGEEIYIINNTAKELKKVSINVKEIIYNARIGLACNTFASDSQEVITVSTSSEEKDRTVSINIEGVYKGNLQLYKKGTYKNNGTKQTENLANVNFKIYNQTLNKWVNGNNNNITYVDSVSNATTYTTDNNGQVSIKGLLSGDNYKYTIAEISANNGYYNDPIKMKSATITGGERPEGRTAGTTSINGTSYYVIDNITLLKNTTTSLSVTIEDPRTSGNLTIIKQDSQETDLKLKGAKFKIMLEKAENIGNTNSWLSYKADSNDYTGISHNAYLSSNKTSAVEFETDENGKIEIKGIINGTYRIYETVAPSGYSLDKQTGYDSTNNWVDCGTVTISSENNNATFTVNNKIISNLTIIKQDKYNNSQKLQGAEFKIKLEEAKNTGDKNKWLSSATNVSNDYTNMSTSDYLKSDKTEANRFRTDENGEIKIKGIINGTYHIYETTAPDGYKLTEQDGYDEANDWVDCGTVTISSNNSKVTYKVNNGNKECSLTIRKKDSDTGDLLSGAEFFIVANLDENLDSKLTYLKGHQEGNNFVVDSYEDYSVLSKDVVQDGTIKATNGGVTITGLKYGNYSIYETKAPDGYSLSNQKNYIKGAEVESVLYEPIYINTWKGTNDNEDLNVTRIESTNEIKYEIEIKNTKTKKLKITKKDENATDINLTDGKFKIYAELKDGTKGWVKGNTSGNKTYENSASNATEYSSDQEIQDMKYGTYYIYETKAPTGYNIKKQTGYQKKTGKGYGTLTGDWVYLGSQEIKSDSSQANLVEFQATNKKIVSLEGYVWKDNKSGKNDAFDNVCSNETKLSGITVTLRKSDGSTIKSATTDSNGKYTFADLIYWDLPKAYVEFTYDNQKYICVDPFALKNRKLDASVNSKAQEYEMTTDELNDDKLTGTGGDIPGKAVTYKPTANLTNQQILNNNKTKSAQIKNITISQNDLKTATLTDYYDNSTYTISNINLGLVEKTTPEYSISEELEYMKLEINGWEFKYKYGQDAELEGSPYPSTNIQNSAKTYTGSIYPTDVAYNALNGGNKLNVYVIYKIKVTNTTTSNNDGLYVEKTLFLNSLGNKYDNQRYQLWTSGEEQGLGLWSDNGGSGTASYKVTDPNSPYKDGIVSNKTIETYIKFKIKTTALTSMLSNENLRQERENAPTQAIANGYHEYLRTDYLWNHDSNIRAFNGWSNNSQYPTKNSSGRKYYVHKSKSQERQSGSLYFKITIGEARTISGTVFKDNNEKNNGEIIGNGKLDNGEAKVEGVKVELLNLGTENGSIIFGLDEVANLYQVKYEQDMYGVIIDNDGNKYEVGTNGIISSGNPNPIKASTTTDGNGFYKFEGVMPGYYIVRFTYGDGTQKYTDTKGNQVSIKSSDYKSTIISEDNMSTMMRNGQNLYWYKKINGNASIATDNILEKNNNIPDNYSYEKTDDIEYGYKGDENKGTRDSLSTLDVTAETPYFGVLIENCEDDNMQIDVKNLGLDAAIDKIKDFYHLNKYEKFNFGIIESPKTKIDLQNIITNLTLTNQVGTNLVSANPTDTSTQYISSVDTLGDGSKVAKIEIDPNQIYGSALTATYEITITNNSDLDYIEEVGSPVFGYYYKYGTVATNAEVKKEVVIKEVQDKLEGKIDTTGEKELKGTKTTESGTSEEVKIKMKIENGNATITFDDSLGLKRGESVSMKYDTKTLLSEMEDTGYITTAQVTKIGLAQLTTLTSSSTWHEPADTSLSITPPTGQNKSYEIYIISGTILIVMGVGILLIKKFVL